MIVNAAAYTSVDQAEKGEKQAHIINADAPALMAEEAKRIGASLVHYSTDYVFDGSSSLPYAETDQPKSNQRLRQDKARRGRGHSSCWGSAPDL
jgi:dTDP-4-dehydrorhamnose reductase